MPRLSKVEIAATTFLGGSLWKTKARRAKKFQGVTAGRASGRDQTGNENPKMSSQISVFSAASAKTHDLLVAREQNNSQ